MPRDARIDKELRDRLADGRVLPVIDVGPQGEMSSSRLQALARLLSSTKVQRSSPTADRPPCALYWPLRTRSGEWPRGSTPDRVPVPSWCCPPESLGQPPRWRMSGSMWSTGDRSAGNR